MKPCRAARDGYRSPGWRPGRRRCCRARPRDRDWAWQKGTVSNPASLRPGTALIKLWFIIQCIVNSLELPVMRGVNLAHLRFFVDVIVLGSFSAADQKHGLAQPAVSLQIRQLDRRYGLRLSERVERHVAPTAAGADLVA